MLLVADIDPIDLTGNETLFAISDNSEKRYFFDNNLQAALTNKQQKDTDSSYDKFYNFYTSPTQNALDKQNITFVKFSHQIYPLQKFSFTKKRTIRDQFVQPWAETIEKRSLLKLFDDTPTTPAYKDVSIPPYNGNAMGLDLLYFGPRPEGTAVVTVSGNVVANSRHPLDTSISGTNFIEGNLHYGFPFGLSGSYVTSSVAGTHFTDLRTRPLPNTNYTGTYDDLAASHMSYGTLRDFKSCLNAFLVHVPTASALYGIGVPITTASLGVGGMQENPLGYEAWQFSGFPSRSYGPLLELPWITTITSYTNFAVANAGYVAWHPSFFVPWSAPTNLQASELGDGTNGVSGYGLGPSYYNDHLEFSEFVKIVGKDHSLIPEYRISQHIGELVTGSSKLSSDLVSSREITGSSNATTNLPTYEDGDLLVNFGEFKQKHNTFVTPSKLRLKIEAITKLLPYDGFYPAERTVQLVSIFSESIEPARRPIFSDSNRLPGQSFRTLLQPLFAPGILYNSIKAGLGISYGMLTGSGQSGPVPTFAPTKPSNDAGTAGAAAFLTNAYSASVTGAINGTWISTAGANHLALPHFLKIPFEDLVTLDSLSENQFFDMYSDVSQALPKLQDTLITLNKNFKPLYSMAMSNFLASSIDFCLKDNNLTTIRSKAQKDLAPVAAGDTYKARISLEINRDSLGGGGPARTLWDLNGDRGEAASGWGPPVSGACDRFDASIPTIATDRIWRPGWGEGSVFVDLEWNPQLTQKYTIEEIQSQITSTFSQSMDDFDRAFGYAYFVTASMPNFGDSINFLSRISKPQVEIDPASGLPIKTISPLDTSNTVWTIQPKWETPFLTRNSSNKAAGIWKTFCEIPNETNRAIFKMKISDIEGAYSLKDYLRFPESVDLGKLSETTKIEEAVVCIPYKVIDNKKKFFQISKSKLKRFITQATKSIAKGEQPNEWYDLNELLDKYVFPPAFDFKRNKDILPLGMIVKEYEVGLDREDVSLYWQNLPPKPMALFDFDTSYVEVDLATTDLFPKMFDGSNPIIKWVIFKVKKRAKTNYFTMTADNPDFAQQSFETIEVGGSKYTIEDYSYNYPYDFCSLVETAKITAEVDFVKKTDD